ncbi:MAG: hypothetical protein RIC89_01965, partial [Pseudomonadales bacterium]
MYDRTKASTLRCVSASLLTLALAGCASSAPDIAPQEFQAARESIEDAQQMDAGAYASDALLAA